MASIPNSSQRHERVEKILIDINEILQKSSETAIKKLGAYVAEVPKSGQIYATLELFSDQNYCLSYNRFFVKDEGEKKILDTEWDVYNNAEKSFIPELDAYAAQTLDGVDYSDSEQQDFGPRHSKQLFEWFKQCWHTAGGKEAKTPTFFAMNKEYMCQDLETGEQWTEEEAAKRLGYEVEGL